MTVESKNFKRLMLNGDSTEAKVITAKMISANSIRAGTVRMATAEEVAAYIPYEAINIDLAKASMVTSKAYNGELISDRNTPLDRTILRVYRDDGTLHQIMEFEKITDGKWDAIVKVRNEGGE